MENNFKSLDNYINQIIKSDDSYIDIDRLMEFIEQMDLTIEEKNIIIKKVYSYNLTITQKITKENEELEKIENTDADGIANIKLHIPLKTIVSSETEQINNKPIDISNYVEFIEQISEPDDFIVLADMVNEHKYEEVINYLLKHYYLELITIKRLQYEEKNNNDFNEYEQHIKDIIDNLHYLQISQQQDDLSINNQILYLTTQYGNNIFLNSLNQIPSEYYDNISIAFNSIINGNFKNNKRVGKKSDGFYSALLEVKSDKVRIFYLKITSNLYLIIDVIIKKFNTNNEYGRFIRGISKEGFLQIKKFLKMTDSEQQTLLGEHANATAEIGLILNGKKRLFK
ncbi:MAG: hypothetical protein HFI87_07785 [Bacilli bacterium]|nr:hypothetical protein [Bacilli bacterium]